eukprot:scaffold127928_cov75-Phaeocystis_antarctica.AAC.2
MNCCAPTSAASRGSSCGSSVTLTEARAASIAFCSKRRTQRRAVLEPQTCARPESYSSRLPSSGLPSSGLGEAAAKLRACACGDVWPYGRVASTFLANTAARSILNSDLHYRVRYAALVIDEARAPRCHVAAHSTSVAQELHQRRGAKAAGMRTVQSDVLRAVVSPRVVSQAGQVLRTGSGGSEATFNLSEPVDEIDIFLSHSWRDSGLLKYLALCLHFNSVMAMVAALTTPQAFSPSFCCDPAR